MRFFRDLFEDFLGIYGIFFEVYEIFLSDLLLVKIVPGGKRPLKFRPQRKIWKLCYPPL